MEYTELLNTFLALAFVLALMGLLALMARRMGLSQNAPGGKNKRLRVIETLPLDHKRKAVLLARDDKQHLVILGPNGETVVETQIQSRENDAVPKNDEHAKPFD